MVKWQAREFKKQEKSFLWYLIWAVLSLAIIIFAILQKSPLMAIVFVLIAVIVYLFAQKEPKKIEFVVSKKGVKIDDKLYDYEDLESFWIFYDPPRKKILSLKSKKLLMPYISIPIAKQNPVKLRKYLLEFLSEKEQEESFVENLPL